MGNSLYDLTNDFLEVVTKLEDMELDEAALSDTLESLQQPIEEKAENIIKYVRNIEALATAKKEEAKRLQSSASADLLRAENILKYLDENLKRANIDKMQAGLFEVKYRKGSTVVQIDENQLPAQYWVPQDPKPMSKTDLKKRLQAGETIPGAQLIKKSDTLVIK